MSSILARFVIHRGNDPFTPPKSKTVWVKDSFGIKWPVLKWSYMRSEIVVVVKGPDEQRVKDAVNDAIGRAAIKSLIVGLASAYLTGGSAGLSAAANTFISELDAVVEAAVGAAVDTSYEIQNESEWGPWQ